MKQMAIGPDAINYRPSDDKNQRSIRSNSTAVRNRAEGQNSDESNASQQHIEYSSADECGRSGRIIDSESRSSAAATAAAGASATLSPTSATAAWNGDGEAAEAIDT